MTDKTYIKIMESLVDEFERINSTELYDEEAFGKVLESIRNTNRIWCCSLRCRIYLSWFVWIAIICFLAWIIYSILRYVEI